MGVEVSDICMDKEPDCVVYLNGEVVSDHHGVLESYEPINGDSEVQSSGESTEAKDYEVKECTNEVSVQNTQPANGNQSQKGENVVGLKVMPGSQKRKDDKKSRTSVKPASKTAGVVPTKHTVPQPFALATEKRASSGARPSGHESEASMYQIKSSNVKKALHPNATKQNQVSAPNYLCHDITSIDKNL